VLTELTYWTVYRISLDTTEVAPLAEHHLQTKHPRNPSRYHCKMFPTNRCANASAFSKTYPARRKHAGKSLMDPLCMDSHNAQKQPATASGYQVLLLLQIIYSFYLSFLVSSLWQFSGAFSYRLF